MHYDGTPHSADTSVDIVTYMDSSFFKRRNRENTEFDQFLIDNYT